MTRLRANGFDRVHALISRSRRLGRRRIFENSLKFHAVVNVRFRSLIWRQNITKSKSRSDDQKKSWEVSTDEERILYKAVRKVDKLTLDIRTLRGHLTDIIKKYSGSDKDQINKKCGIIAKLA